MPRKRKPKLTERHMELLRRLYATIDNEQSLADHPELAIELFLEEAVRNAEKPHGGSIVRQFMHGFCSVGAFDYELKERAEAAKEKRPREFEPV